MFLYMVDLLYVKMYNNCSGVMMIKKQREKEFLFELELLYYNFNLTVCGNEEEMWLHDIGDKEMPEVTKEVEKAIDWLKERR